MRDCSEFFVDSGALKESITLLENIHAQKETCLLDPLLLLAPRCHHLKFCIADNDPRLFHVRSYGQAVIVRLDVDARHEQKWIIEGDGSVDVPALLPKIRLFLGGFVMAVLEGGKCRRLGARLRALRVGIEVGEVVAPLVEIISPGVTSFAV